MNEAIEMAREIMRDYDSKWTVKIDEIVKDHEKRIRKLEKSLSIQTEKTHLGD